MANSRLSYDPLCNSYTQPNPDIAGIGVVIGIMSQSLLVLIVSLYRSYLAFPSRQKYTRSNARQEKIKITNKILLLCSDVQSILGFSILTAAMSQIRQLSLYHAVIVYHLAILTLLSHFSALRYLLHEKIQSLIPRLFFIFASLVLFAAFGLIIWPRLAHWADKPGWCYRQDKSPLAGQHPYSSSRYAHIALTLVMLVAYLLLFASRLLRSTIRLDIITSRWQIIRLFWIPLTAIFHLFVFLLAASGLLSVYIPSSSLIVEDNGAGRREQELWGFGQIIAVLSLLGILLSAYGIWDENRVVPANKNTGDDQLRKMLIDARAKVQELENLLAVAHPRISQLEEAPASKVASLQDTQSRRNSVDPTDHSHRVSQEVEHPQRCIDESAPSSPQRSSRDSIIPGEIELAIWPSDHQHSSQ